VGGTASKRADDELFFLTLAEAARLLKGRKISPLELTEAVLGRIERLNPLLNAYLLVTADQARATARNSEREILHGDYRGPLHGIPICLKDNFYTRGVITTAGSQVLRNFIPRANSDVVAHLQEAGAVMLGKTNLHEFAYGVTSVNPHYGWVRNPWDETRISGGSSGGSAAAVVAGLAYGSVGTDTGGSIRNPAALCGIVGLKPTYGLVSLNGVVPLALSMDHAGPMARTVRDAAILLDAIARAAATTASSKKSVAPKRKAGPRYAASLDRPIKGLRLGWPVRCCYAGATPEVERAVNVAARVLESEGAKLREISLDGVEATVEAANIVARAEALAYHAQAGYFPGRASEYGRDVKSHLQAARKISALDYLRALGARDVLRGIFEGAFKNVDGILAPTLPVTAPLRDQDVVRLANGEESVRSVFIRFSRPANFAGLPAVSVPCGFSDAGLPIGLQIIGPAWEDARVLQIAHAYERASGWHEKHPLL
jgi:aspartyl-tRNA(Asn)/glutamyl-tRNA(Gln) amidotransferase subunit A